jgi:hypothetical protein
LLSRILDAESGYASAIVGILQFLKELKLLLVIQKVVGA